VRIEILPRAGDDIIRQFRFYLVEQDEPATALRFREAVVESIEQLRPHPRIGAPVQGLISGLRSWPVKGFEAVRIYYQESPQALRVLRVLHGKRDVRRILAKEKS
jgi:plasmid stabilization system protein ParE